MRIRYLPEHLINQIAAGEVIERPAAAVKEMVENAIDAGASRIDVSLNAGGKSRISISDDGSGMSREELDAALDRHATSKLPDDDLFNILHLGFRGEALASIASVSRLRIASRRRGANEAWEISCSGGRKEKPAPSSHPAGTQIIVEDLFFATPARLKFLKSDKAEFMAVRDVLVRLAMARPDIGFTLSHEGRTTLKLPPGHSTAQRLSAILGSEFEANALRIDTARDESALSGFAGLPTYNRGTSGYQYLFVNGRPVRDRLLLSAIRGAYADVLARDRHPAVALFLDLKPEDVDVNVHPAKTEVRFRDPGGVRGLIVGALKHALHEGGFRSSSSVAAGTLGSFRPYQAVNANAPSGSPPPRSNPASYGFSENWAPHAPRVHGNLAETDTAPYAHPSSEQPAYALPQTHYFPLGAARAQLHENYIVAQTEDGIVIVDQHAAHERLVYERMKARLAENGILKQGLLTPEIVMPGDMEADILLENADDLARLGLEIEAFGKGAIAVQAIPALLGEKTNIQALIRDLCDEIMEQGSIGGLEERLNAILSRMSCHGSVRSGRRMNPAEMDALLRQMEETPLSGQCNHGRPTYIELKLSDIEKLFGRR